MSSQPEEQTQQVSPNFDVIPAYQKATVMVEGKETRVQAWMVDRVNSVVVALVQEGLYLRTPLAIAATNAKVKDKGDS